MGSNCPAQPTFRPHVLKAGPSDLGHTEEEQKYNFTAVGVLQEHSAGASGTGQSEEPSEETPEDEWHVPSGDDVIQPGAGRTTRLCGGKSEVTGWLPALVMRTCRSLQFPFPKTCSAYNYVFRICVSRLLT